MHPCTLRGLTGLRPKVRPAGVEWNFSPQNRRTPRDDRANLSSRLAGSRPEGGLTPEETERLTPIQCPSEEEVWLWWLEHKQQQRLNLQRAVDASDDEYIDADDELPATGD